MGTCKVRFADKNTYLLLKERLKKALNGVYMEKQEVLRVYEPGNTEANLLE
jgi:hypothetical protein